MIELPRFRIGAVACLGLFLLSGSPAWAAPFDAPFNGMVDIDVVAFSVSGSTGLGPISAVRTGSTPGTVDINSRVADAGDFGLSYTWVMPLGTVPITRSFTLVGVADTVGNGNPLNASYPLDPTDALPPSDPVGTLSGDAHFNDDTNIGLGGGNVLNADQIVFDTMVSRTPIPGGEQYVYDVIMFQSIFTAAYGPLIFSMAGQATVNATPEPASLAIMGLGCVALLLRRRTR